MTAPPDLHAEVLRVLGAESPARPLRLESLREVLVCARGIYPEAGQLEAAIHVLMDAGSIEVVHHVRLGARYRLQRHRRGVDMSEPEPPRAA
jgi:hypothetical protein